jgi:glutathione S-transferase
MNGKQSRKSRLITFPPSSDCETGRWTLHHYGIAFDEEPNAPPFFLLAVGLRGGKKFPLFLSDGMLLNGARPIIDHFERLAEPERRLIPDEHKDAIEEDWQTFNITMGAATVQWAYSHLLPHKAIMIRPLSLGTPWYQRATVRYCYWLPKTFLWNALKLGPEAAEQALNVLKRTFAQVDQRLADGRRYLHGDRLTLADIAFSVAGAPLVLPDGYGGYQHEQGPVPTFEQFPPDARAVISEMRGTAAGQFVLRMYREERYGDTER